MKPAEIRILFESKFDKGNTELAVICRLCSDTSQNMKNTAAPVSSHDEGGGCKYRLQVKTLRSDGNSNLQSF